MPRWGTLPTDIRSRPRRAQPARPPPRPPSPSHPSPALPLPAAARDNHLPWAPRLDLSLVKLLPLEHTRRHHQQSVEVKCATDDKMTDSGEVTAQAAVDSWTVVGGGGERDGSFKVETAGRSAGLGWAGLGWAGPGEETVAALFGSRALLGPHAPHTAGSRGEGDGSVLRCVVWRYSP